MAEGGVKKKLKTIDSSDFFYDKTPPRLYPSHAIVSIWGRQERKKQRQVLTIFLR
jgi:hypothetical protein